MSSTTLKAANENPWYCLATLYGEQIGQSIDQELHARNRIGWNRWIVMTSSEEQRKKLPEIGFTNEEAKPLSEQEPEKLNNDFSKRTGNRFTLPDVQASINFDRTLFARPISFEHYFLPAPISCQEAHFSERAKFSSVIFSDQANFNSATFSGEADFRSATFSDIVDFSAVKFSSEARFTSVTFSNHADFSAVMFSDVAEFGSATFSGIARFRSATFSAWANFNSATFSAWANFNSTTFSNSAYFNSASFSNAAHFSAATFSDVADFISTTFSDAAYFDAATFSKSADFQLTQYRNQSIFVNTEFKAKTLFSESQFHQYVPDFRGAKLHEATEWHGIKWPPAASDKEEAQAQVYAYEKLKLEMERLKKHEDEQAFFRRELRAKRGTVVRWSWPWLLNFCYDFASGYGQSLTRPALGLVGLWLIGAMTYPFAWPVNHKPMHLALAALTSFATIFSFLPTRQVLLTPEVAAGLATSRIAEILSALQALLGGVLLFLFGLALRNRFRMR